MCRLPSVPLADGMGSPIGGGCSLNSVSTEEIELVDRVAMDDLLTRYATAIDRRDWDLLDTVFTHTARLDYRSASGIEGIYPEIRTWFAEVLPIFDVTQHLVVNREFRRANGEVHARSCFLNVNRLTVEGKPWLFTVGGQYHDQLINTSGGWRIARRVEHTLWWDNPMPGLPEVPFPLSYSPLDERP
jgi:hypothetical protein